MTIRDEALMMPQDVKETMRMFDDPLFQADIFYSYAKQAEEGCIVELGTYRGRGAIALALGTRDGHGLKVYTIDDYSERKGWIGESYGSEDKGRFLVNIKAAGLEEDITLLQMDILKAAVAFRKRWEEGISLLLWDAGVPDRIEEDFDAWKDYIVPGGVFLMKDAQDYCLGSNNIIAWVEKSGGWEIVRYDSLITALRKSE